MTATTTARTTPTTLQRLYSNLDNYPIYCYYIELNGRGQLEEPHLNLIRKVLGCPPLPPTPADDLGRNEEMTSTDGATRRPTRETQIEKMHDECDYIEIGPRLNFRTPWCSSVLELLRRIWPESSDQIKQIERTRLYPRWMTSQQIGKWDRMTETQYYRPLLSLSNERNPEKFFRVAKEEWHEFNEVEGLGFDEFDLELYSKLRRTLRWADQKSNLASDLTDVELFDLAQSNSEHSRHWLFRGRFRFSTDDNEYEDAPSDTSLMDVIREPLIQLRKRRGLRDNSLVAMRDNSSAIRGFHVRYLAPVQIRGVKGARGNAFQVDPEKLVHPIFTAETHNFPTGIAPFPGAATGVGGRIRDIQAIGRGGLMGVGTVGYCVGNLENPRSSQILIEASNGASDYGNKIGEPQIVGFCRSFGLDLRTCSGESKRIEWQKPIMFSGGLGTVFDEDLEKEQPSLGLLIVRLGGPAYRIGVGGGSASSRPQHTGGSVDNGGVTEKDLAAVQRGDPEMEQRLHRVIQACVELGDRNPIRSIHDQGAGGMGNVTKEIVSPLGGLVNLENVVLGDRSLSAREIWIAEYQEQNTCLIHPRDAKLLREICERENLPCAFVGFVTDDGRIQVIDKDTGNLCVDLELGKVLESVPRKTFTADCSKSRWIAASKRDLKVRLGQLVIDVTQELFDSNSNRKVPPPLLFPRGIVRRRVFWQQLKGVLGLVSVGSKRFLTNKVDRSVSGLVAQQQCVGPLGTPMANCGVKALGYLDKVGAVTAIGEQPIKGITAPGHMARMAVGEMLTNIVWAPITDIEDIKLSGNWMWEKRDPQEIAALIEAVECLSACCIDLGLAIDGGKDSLSMSTICRNPETGKEETVLCPRSLVVSGYCTCTDIRRIVTPDLKRAGNLIFFVDLGMRKQRLGGSALAQSLGTVGGSPPDVENTGMLRAAFEAIQRLIEEDIIVSGHDRSDGGLITTLLEMAMGGNLGFDVDLWGLVDDNGSNITEFMFNEELGLILEIEPHNASRIIAEFSSIPVRVAPLGKVISEPWVKIVYGSFIEAELGREGSLILLDSWLSEIRELWESQNFRLESEQVGPHLARSERDWLLCGQNPRYHVPGGLMDLMTKWKPSYDHLLPSSLEELSDGTGGIDGTEPSQQKRPCVAIVREEGSNGDREMAAAFAMVGFSCRDVTVSDLVSGRTSILEFQGLAFVGGFSFADVLGAGRAWALSLTEHAGLREELEQFRRAPNRFSLGVCNGAQLLAELGWVPGKFTQNLSKRFESRWSTVAIPSETANIGPRNRRPRAIMLKGMEGLKYGIWVAHGEGRYLAPKVGIDPEQVCLQYINGHEGTVTSSYPENPNGSEEGIAAVCSTDGRHLAMMPHPERCVMDWQAQWIDPTLRVEGRGSGTTDGTLPWLQMFRNAYDWCQAVNSHD